MDSPQRIPNKGSSEPQPQHLSPSGSRKRRISNDCGNSPEFEFWRLRNPSFPQPNLHSADELFVDGVLLPLRLLHLQNNSQDDPPDVSKQSNIQPEPEPQPGPEICSQPGATSLTASKRWKDIFSKKGDKKTAASNKQKDKDKDREKKRDKKSPNAAPTGASAGAELNINIWPFSRSRSVGNNGLRPKTAAGASGTRKVSSAPCSRSNSAGESKSRKWPSSPGRPGVHVGRSSPVWQVRRGGGASVGGPGLKIHNTIANNHSEAVVRAGEKRVSKKEATETRRHDKTAMSGGGASGKAKVLNLNVPMCIGYRNHLSCRSHENSALVVGGGSSTGGKISGNGGGNSGGNTTTDAASVGSLFNLRSLFTKKVY